MNPLILSGIGSILGPIGGVLAAKEQAKQSARNIASQAKYNKELAQYRYSKDLEMWERANLYNSPTKQMERLKEAGINPNLVFGGNNPNMQAATLPQYNEAAPDFSKRKSPMVALAALQGFQDAVLKAAQIDNVRSKTDTEKQNALWQKLNVQQKMKLQPYFAEMAKNQAQMTGAKLLHERRKSFKTLQEQGLIEEKKESTAKDVELKGQRKQIQDFELNFWKEIGTMGKYWKMFFPMLRYIMR